VPERIALVVNPASTRAAGAVHRELIDTLTPLGLEEVLPTARREHATELAADARNRGATVVVVAGGDGTINEAARALVESDVALLPVAAGSTNVFARALGWPHPASRAIPAIRDALTGGANRRELTVGRIQSDGLDRIFCINMGFGVDGETVQMIESHPWVKRRLRQAGFGAMALAATVRAARPGKTARVAAEGHDVMELASLIVVAGSPYAYVGPVPLDLAPGARFDGNLRWLGIERNRPTVLAGVLRDAVLPGTRPGGRGNGVRDGWTSTIEIRSDVPLAMQVDGEPIGWHAHATISAGPHLTVVVPPEGVRGGAQNSSA